VGREPSFKRVVRTKPTAKGKFVMGVPLKVEAKDNAGTDLELNIGGDTIVDIRILGTFIVASDSCKELL